MPNTHKDLTVTRYGAAKPAEIKFGSEERFAWQRPQFMSDVVYDLPELRSSKSAVFGTASRAGMEDENPDAKKRSNGPGSYDFGHCYDFNSEYSHKKAYRFSVAPRQSLAMKTPSPGAIYNIENQFYLGPEKNKGISFSTDIRRPLGGGGASADAEMVCPKLPKGPAITIGRRINRKDALTNTPGAIYDVHVSR